MSLKKSAATLLVFLAEVKTIRPRVCCSIMGFGGFDMRYKTFLLAVFLTWQTSVSEGQSLKKILVLPVVVQGPVDGDRFFETRIHTISANLPQSICKEGFTNVGGFLEVGCLITPTRQECIDFGDAVGRRSYNPAFGTCRTKFEPLQDGWVRLTFSGSGSLEVSSEVVLKNAGGTLAAASIPAIVPALEFLAPALKSANEIVGYAIVNPSRSETALLKLELQHFSKGPTTNLITCQFELSIKPEHRISKLLDEFLRPCELPQNFTIGTLQINSNLPIAVAAVKIILPEAFLVNLTVERR